MAKGLYLLRDGQVLVEYGKRRVPISVAQYRANGYRPSCDKLLPEALPTVVAEAEFARTTLTRARHKSSGLRIGVAAPKLRSSLSRNRAQGTASLTPLPFTDPLANRPPNAQLRRRRPGPAAVLLTMMSSFGSGWSRPDNGFSSLTGKMLIAAARSHRQRLREWNVIRPGSTGAVLRCEPSSPYDVGMNRIDPRRRFLI